MIYLIIILHLLSDWLLQPRKVATRKSSSDKWLGIHILIIFVVFAAYCLIAGLPIYLALINAVLHGIIDRTIWRGYKKIRHGEYTQKDIDNKYIKVYTDDWFWKTIGVDQALHLCILMYLFV